MGSSEQVRRTVINDRMLAQGGRHEKMAEHNSERGSAKLDGDPIAAALKKIHDSVADEPLPDDFLDLLEQIDRKISAADEQL
jgi:Anti-sigma factor NepR